MGKKERALNVVLVVLVVSLILASSQLAFTLANAPKIHKIDIDLGRITLGIDVVGYNHTDGSVLGEHHNDTDPLTTNWASYMAGIFQDTVSRDSPQMTYNHTGGTNVGINMRERYYDYAFSTSWTQASFNGGDPPWVGGCIAIGNSTTAATIRDNKLLSIDSAYTTTNYTFYDLAGNVTVAANCTVVGTQSVGISEAGLFMRTDPYIVMMARETFTPIPCNINDTITVSYTFVLNNAGFNDNLGYFFGGLWGWCPDGNPESIDAYTNYTQYCFQEVDGARPQNVSRYGSNDAHPHSDVLFWQSGNGYGDFHARAVGGIRIGTSNVAANRTQYNLQAEAHSDINGVETPVIKYNVTAGTTNITLAAVFQFNQSFTFNEAGYFIKGRVGDVGTSGLWEFMLWRVTFSDYVYTAGDWLEVTFRLVSG